MKTKKVALSVVLAEQLAMAMESRNGPFARSTESLCWNMGGWGLLWGSLWYMGYG
jgi:hypothetical protein